LSSAIFEGEFLEAIPMLRENPNVFDPDDHEKQWPVHVTVNAFKPVFLVDC
jgi:hypothetical protein